jgi:uncharacterized membrane protein
MMKRMVRIILAAFFLVAGALHFLMDTVFAQIVPPFLPYPIAIVWGTGVMEICFGAALLTGRFLPQTGLLLSLYLLAVLPANIYMAMAGIDFGNDHLTPAVLWARVALQFPLVAFVLWATQVRR